MCARRKGELPRVRHHKGRRQEYVCYQGKQIYLGKIGSAEARENYRRFINELTAAGMVSFDCSSQDASPGPSAEVPHPHEHLGVPRDLAVVELAAAYLDHAVEYYQKGGKPTGHLSQVRVAVGALDKLFGDLPARQFGPLRLEAMQRQFIADGKSRRYINDLIHVVRRVFKWGASKEMLPGSVYEALRTVSGLKRGRSKARETTPVGPVDDATVQATLPFLPAVLADMVRFERLTGCRPTEACIVRPCDVDKSGEIWIYRPATHKVEHHGRARIVFIGPKAQDLLRPYLLRAAQSYCFSPAESEREHNAERREARRSRRTPSQRARLRDRRGGHGRAGDCYTKNSYNRAVRRACDKADLAAHKARTEISADERIVPRWTPNQLRHSAGTEIRKHFGLEAVQVVLGHAEADVSQIYAEIDLNRGIEVARRIG